MPNKVIVECLAFADGTALTADLIENTQEQIKELQHLSKSRITNNV